MTGLRAIRLRTLAWLLLPIAVLVLIPCWLRRVAHETVSWHGGLGQWCGVWSIMNGLGLAAWCVNLFNVEGRGTPLPFDPPQRFVSRGPYRYVRNPMMLGMFLILIGETLVYESRMLIVYAAALVVLAHLFVMLWEEPDLLRRFGESYRTYRQQVPRWIPRRKPISRE